MCGLLNPAFNDTAFPDFPKEKISPEIKSGKGALCSQLKPAPNTSVGLSLLEPSAKLADFLFSEPCLRI
jgi:hypothetical protein